MGERVFTMPDLGEGLEEAVVTAWLVAEGDEVELNRSIAEIETAKAVVEMPSPFAGRIARLHVPEGATVAVGAPIVTFEVAEADEAVDPAVALTTATPAVRAFARDRGVDLQHVRGSGPGGRIVREDVERAAGDTDAELVSISAVRRLIADTLTTAAAIPHVTTFRDVDCTALEALRHEIGSSPLPVLVRALAEIAGDHPWINASWEGEAIRLHRVVNAGIATDTERGLLVPVVKDVRALGIGALADEIDLLARSAREGALTPEQTTGATIAVTNTGSYGSQSGTPLLNLGHAVTVALGAIVPRALVVEGRVEARPACTLSVTFDHRVLDGATLGRALGALVELLESGERLASLPR